MAAATASVFLFFLSLFVVAEAAGGTEFSFHGFNDTESNITREGATIIKPTGLLRLTNRSNFVIGHAFYSTSIQMLEKTNFSTTASVPSFSTCFVFSIVPASSSGGFGLAFTIAPRTTFPGAGAEHFLGLFNYANDGNQSNHIFAVEFDTVNGHKHDKDTEGNHIGVNVNGMNSSVSEPAAYIKEGTIGDKEEFNLEDVDAVRAWIDYDGHKKTLNVTIAPLGIDKPSKPLINSHRVDLSAVVEESMYIGFSSSTGNKASSHYILGWSFSMNGAATDLNISRLPNPPPKEQASSSFPWVKFVIGTLAALTLILLIVLLFVVFRKRYMQFETLEDWELDCPHRFKYRDLHTATKGFNESEMIGVGGFGTVYKGVLPTTGVEVAVKRIARGPIQGMREFAAEIESLGRLRHKNLVNLQGWCKRKNDLLLVYDYIPYGGLDSLLFNRNDGFVLDWNQRFTILKGIAAGLLYLHEEWEQVVIHRDVKTSNILIDADLNARLGDFGLARLYDHGQVSHTTSVVGTIGYIAPELTRTGKASASSDAYAYGVLLLEVASGRRPIGFGQFFLVDWVIENYRLGQILEVADPKLNSNYVDEEMELVLKLGLLCTQHRADSRPTMRQVTRYLNGDDNLPDVVDLSHSDSHQSSRLSSGFMEAVSTCTTSTSYNLSSVGKTTISIEAGR